VLETELLAAVDAAVGRRDSLFADEPIDRRDAFIVFVTYCWKASADSK
jgi:hypothetical protein